MKKEQPTHCKNVNYSFEILFAALTKPSFTCGHAAKRSKVVEGKGAGHEAHHKIEELLRETLNNPLMHSVPFYSLAGPS